MLYTGDLFRRDAEGFLYFIGRKDDLIKTRGERVSPREVENVLCQAPGVAEAAVIAVPDELLGQAVRAFVVPAPGVRLAPREVLRYCAGHMEPLMVPASVVVLPALPKNANGKVDRHQLRAMQEANP